MLQQLKTTREEESYWPVKQRRLAFEASKAILSHVAERTVMGRLDVFGNDHGLNVLSELYSRAVEWLLLNTPHLKDASRLLR